jgi:hypothetical protein
VKKFNQARVNGGSNYDSLNFVGENSRGGLTSHLCLLVEVLYTRLRDEWPLVGPCNISWFGEGLLLRLLAYGSTRQYAERVDLEQSLLRATLADLCNAR